MFSISTGLQSLLALLMARCIYLRYFHPLSKYPGPFLASFTNLWTFYTFLTGKHHLVEHELHDRYGPIIRTGPHSLTFASLAAFDAIYGFNRSMEKGDFYSSGRDPVTGEENIFAARTDTSHRERRRKVAGPAFSSTTVATYKPAISKNVSIFLSRLADARSFSNDGLTVDLAPYTHSFTFVTLTELIYGDSISSQPYTSTKRARDVLVAFAAFRDFFKWAWAAPLLPWFGWLMSTRLGNKIFRRPTYDAEGNLTSIAALGAATREAVLACPEKALESDQSSMLRTFLQVPDGDSKRMRPKEMWRECWNLTFAGPGSTSAALTAVLYKLGTDKGREWQDRLRAEIGTHIALSSSPVLSAVIKETLRLHPPFPTGFPRTIGPGDETCIPCLPAPLPVGTTVSANSYILGRSKEIWGADAETWKPQRWLQATESEKKVLEEGFVVFGKGPRGCIGKEIAMTMVREALGGVLGRWDIRAREGGELRGKGFLEMQYQGCEVGLEEVGRGGAEVGCR